jgi:hypothetical protein
LLDLSDRIILSPGQINRDKELINIIWGNFRELTRKQLFLNSRDVFQIIVADQENSSLDEVSRQEFQDSLYIDLSRFKTNEKKIHALNKKKIDRFGKKLKSRLDLLYKNSSTYNHPSLYNGADIFKFFEEDLGKRLIKGYKNHVFILTDGYLFVKDLSKELSDSFPNSDFKVNEFDLNVCMLEIAPKDKLHGEFKKRKIVWGKWFSTMGIKEMCFTKKSDNLKLNETKISDFLFSKDREEFKIILNEKKNGSSINDATPKKKKNSLTPVLSTLDPLADLSDDDFVNEFLTKEIYDDNSSFSLDRLKRLSEILINNFPNKLNPNYILACSCKSKILVALDSKSIDNSELYSILNKRCPF